MVMVPSEPFGTTPLYSTCLYIDMMGVPSIHTAISELLTWSDLALVRDCEYTRATASISLICQLRQRSLALRRYG